MKEQLASEQIKSFESPAKKRSQTLLYIVSISVIILFFASSLRHLLFQSNAFDLGIFDQAIYLISQGKEPVTSIQGFHIMGDHAAWIHYLLAIPYKIYPSVYWLFFIQSLALALGAVPTYYLSIQAGLKNSQGIAVSCAYLLYPLIFNVNLFDFHPEVIAAPLLLCAVLAARLKKLVLFCSCIILILGCKAVLSLTVIGMGFWLTVFEKRRLYGIFCLISGTIWFIVSVKLIIPFFSGAEAAAVGRYSYLGDSVFEIIKNIIFQPNLIVEKLFSLDNLSYLILLFAPVIWGLSVASLKALIPAIPCIAMNLLTDYYPQKDLVHQYSLPALPFLILAVIISLSVGKGLIQERKKIIIWSLVTFVALAKFTYFAGRYLEFTDNLGATREAVSLIPKTEGVYTTAEITPHLSQRELIKFTNKDNPKEKLEQFDYVLLNIRHAGWQSDELFAKTILNRAENSDNFKNIYQKDDVYLWKKVS